MNLDLGIEKLINSFNKAIGLDKLEKLTSRLERLPLRISADRCLNQRWRTERACGRRCQNVCPKNAVSLKETLDIDFDACVSCGLCVGVCPVGALESTVTDDFVLALVKKAGATGPTLIFTCDKSAVGDGAVEPGVVKLSCLGRLNETILLGAAVFGIKHVYIDAPCEECELTAVPQVLDEVIQATSNLLSVFEYHLDLHQGLPEIGCRRNDEIGDDIVGLHSRRDFLISAKRQLMVGGIDMISERLEKLDYRNESELPYHLPHRRMLLLLLLKKMGAPLKKALPAGSIPVMQLTIDKDKCVVCNNCVLFCPTRALTKTIDGDRGSYDLTVAACTACGLCLEICPVQAISPAGSIDAEQLARIKPEPLLEFSIYRCELCSQDFGSTSPAKQCSFCRKREALIAQDTPVIDNISNHD